LIYLYSDSGEISDQYTKILRAKGYSRALSIVGGLAEWKDRYGDRNIIKGNR
jgi:rhodanese-related sulfurtransferase